VRGLSERITRFGWRRALRGIRARSSSLASARFLNRIAARDWAQ
jgi:hypothetical protein